MRWKTDISEGKTLCLSCYALNEVNDSECKRCKEELSQRKPNSLSITIAFSLGAALLLIPANFMSMMTTSSLGDARHDTILEGVFYFLDTGEYFIAVVIFLASICIPFIKIFILFFISWIAYSGKKELAPLGVRLYRFIQIIGKYSMLDIFVVAIMVSIVQFGQFVEIFPGLAAFFFASAVIMTIIATESFDPRLMWRG